jgi:hypothetical protein
MLDLQQILEPDYSHQSLSTTSSAMTLPTIGFGNRIGFRVLMPKAGLQRAN